MPRRRALVFGVFLLLLLAVASCYTTFAIAEGSFPRAEIRIELEDERGRSIVGAVFEIFESGSSAGEHAIGFPIYEFNMSTRPTSDRNGLLLLHQPQGGLHFGGPSFRLFWILPVQPPVPDHACRISKEGFAPLEFSVWDLFDRRTKQDETASFSFEGREVTLAVFEHEMEMTQLDERE